MQSCDSEAGFSHAACTEERNTGRILHETVYYVLKL
jgi:hypothetical protein